MTNLGCEMFASKEKLNVLFFQKLTSGLADVAILQRNLHAFSKTLQPQVSTSYLELCNGLLT